RGPEVGGHLGVRTDPRQRPLRRTQVPRTVVQHHDPWPASAHLIAPASMLLGKRLYPGHHQDHPLTKTRCVPRPGGTIGDVEIRRAWIGDAAQIGLVHVKAWQGAYRGLLPQEYLDGLDPAQRAGGWERILAADAGPRSGVVAADGDGNLLGFAAFGPARDEDQDPGQTGEVMAIYVL